MAAPKLETPKDFSGLPVHTFVLVKSASICKAAAKKAKALGFNSMILTTYLEAESREAGSLFASIGKEIQRHQRPTRPPCAVVAGGESTVVIHGKPGYGGPNQEFVLGAALKFDESDRVVIAAIDSDGTDGPTSIAGGIVDTSTVTRARKQGYNIFAHLIRHDTSSILQKLSDAIITGHTGTNVNDLKVMLVS
jgi:glycerate-2-kinase